MAGTFFLAIVESHRACAGVNVTTYHYDNARTGLDTNETILTPANVASTNFGQLFTCAVDGYVYAEPLLMTNITIPGRGNHDVVFVATEHDSVYAFDANDADGSNSLPLWHTSFINPAAGVTPVSSTDVGCNDLIPEIGITSTPVIDAATGTIYVEAKTKEVTDNVATFVHRLHALDLATGAEKFGGPVVIQPIVAGTGDGNDGHGHVPFQPLRNLNRPGLLLLNGVVYAGYASHCDIGPYHGWLIGYGAQTLALSNVLNFTPNGGEGGIWSSGCGPAADTNGNIYVITGNGSFDGSTNQDYSNGYLKLSTTNGLAVADFFSPTNQQMISDQDLDLDSSGQMLLPDSAGSVAHPHLMIGCGKQGTIYLVDCGNMGKFDSASNHIVQQLTPANPGLWGSPAFFNNTIYFWGYADALKAYSISNAVMSTAPVSQSTVTVGYPSCTPVVSANGTSNAIVWAIQTDAYGSSGPSVLHALNATNLAHELYNSASANQPPGGAVKFSVPTVANGKVYVGTENSLAVYGLGSFLATPTISPNGQNFAGSVTVTLADSTPGTTIYYTVDSTAPTTNSIPYSIPFVLTNTAFLSVRAFKSGSVPSIVATATFLGSPGTGTGLTGEYFSNQVMTFINPPTLVRTDATINFNWNSSPPDPAIGLANYTVRWTGSVQPQFSETYTFYTATDDGVRLWVNGQLLVDDWMSQAVTVGTGSIALTAGRRYSIALEYFQGAGGASASLSWSCAALPKAIVPQTQLYPTFPPSFNSDGAGFVSNKFQMQLQGLPGKDYILQAGTNLVNWTAIATNYSPTNPGVQLPSATFIFTDSASTNLRNRLYRAVQK